MKRLIFLLGIFFSLTITSHADIQTEIVNYKAGDVNLKGFLAYDDDLEGTTPGILIVHEWWGHNDYAQKRARMLADLGYVAFALDMYGDGKVADHPGTAGEFAGEVFRDMQGIGKTRFLAALDVLKQHPLVDKDNIAAIGYCFGGGTVLHMARYGLDITGVVSFHGSLSTQTPAGAGDIKTKILVCHGAADAMVTDEHVAAFTEEMENAGADYVFKSYVDAPHSFTNPEADEKAKQFGTPIGYNATADAQSWEDMKDFFEEIFSSVE